MTSENTPCASPDDIAIISRSAPLLFARKSRFVAAFYQHLFDALPEARAQFSDDLSHQKDMVMAVLSAILKGFGQPERTRAVLHRLATKHIAHGINPAHLDVGSQALSDAVVDVLGDALSEPERAAWQRLFDAISGELKTQMMMQLG
ncbi:MAG: globin domain-containing protein [Brevirhabdus sp.]